MQFWVLGNVFVCGFVWLGLVLRRCRVYGGCYLFGWEEVQFVDFVQEIEEGLYLFRVGVWGDVSYLDYFGVVVVVVVRFVVGVWVCCVGDDGGVVYGVVCFFVFVLIY